MIDLFTSMICSVSGFGLGLFYFGGLWLTLRHLSVSSNPALFTLLSFLGRSAVCVLGFYMLTGYGLGGLAFGLAGFVLIKITLIHKLSLHAQGRRAKW
jgi:F1F0 ATPase subunit 2